MPSLDVGKRVEVTYCATEHSTSAPTTPTPIPPTGASGVLPLTLLGFALVLGGGLLVRTRRSGS